VFHPALTQRRGCEMLADLEKPFEILDRCAGVPPLAAKLALIGRDAPVLFEHVTESAQPFLAALIARRGKGRVWVICRNVRAQELFHGELLNWFPDALFLPEMELAPAQGALPDPEIGAERLQILQDLSATRERRIIVASHASLTEAVPSPSSLKQITVKLRRAARLNREKLLRQLNTAGYEKAAQVSTRGQYAVRGGILDLFSWHHTMPVRIELFDDVIESIRQFELDSQISVQTVDACDLLLGEAGDQTCSLRDYIQKGDLAIDAVGDEEIGKAEPLSASVRILEGAPGNGGEEDYSSAFFDHGLGEFEAGDFVIEETKREAFFHQLREWREKKWRTYIFCNNEGEIERLRDLIPAEDLESVLLTTGTLSRGFTFPAAGVAVLSDAELFGRYRNTRSRRRSLQRAREQANRAQIDFSELNEGDLVVHLEHGIGKFLGLQNFATGEKNEEVLVLEFDAGAKLYVPLEQSFLVSRYVGVGKRSPTLSTLGDGKWAKAKLSAEKSVFDYAAKLLSIHAERETSTGFAFPPDNKWQHEFEHSFFFKETPDQITAIAAAKSDMESVRPMDRLICGDVGFGKTEVAIRAAFKAVMGGRQVAVLVPTTVLAQQHYHTFRERMSDYPVSIEMLSRFRSQTEQKAVVESLSEGGVDIVIGTHRLISKDVRFKNLGLVVVDEEQRFGVAAKEKFKELFKLVDVLTLSATPIPRTLYLSLMGARDMSVIETPPANRIPTETLICGYDERIIRDAIRRELQRQGQVYFLHNRVMSIERTAQRIKMLCPEARVDIGHGQMNEDELEEVMQRFVDGKSDVLVSTTIIESGLDIPNANTIIIDRADRFGLADLYQLRGRVGRAQHKAYAYLMLPRELMTGGLARKRINAIKQYSSLGAGFKIAMRDLEIRGAGNILGTKQSGHILAVGFDLYCQLLKQAVSKLKGEKVRPRVEVEVHLDFVVTNEAEWLMEMTNDKCQMSKEARMTKPEAGPRKTGQSSSFDVPAFIRHSSSDIESLAVAPHPLQRHFCAAFLPTAYVGEAQTRIQAYRKLAGIATQEQLDSLRKDWRDRFGPLSEAVENLIILSEIKIAAGSRKIQRVEVREKKLMLSRGGDYVLIGGKFPRLTSTTPPLNLREVSALIKSF
jgi:transcription-repair coupling factor (superfamily II helicase)